MYKTTVRSVNDNTMAYTACPSLVKIIGSKSLKIMGQFQHAIVCKKLCRRNRISHGAEVPTAVELENMCIL